MKIKKKSLILGIDTSCDETSAAVLEDQSYLRSNIISSQIKIHQPYGGVVPELASRSHVEALPYVVETAISKAGIQLEDLTGIAVTTSPGLIGCLLVGLSYAKSLAYSLKIPLANVHHLKAHLFSPLLEAPEVYPFLGLVVSGGHTALYFVESFEKITCYGQTVDDAAGEAYDKTAKLLGLGYPGGPVIDRLARNGNPDQFKFTRARVKKGPYYFSFSGLKTAVSLKIKNEAHLRGLQDLTTIDCNLDSFVLDLIASFQKEVVETLIEKVKKLSQELAVKNIFVSGGVAVNSYLRKRLAELLNDEDLLCKVPSPSLCTDNGAMVAWVGARQISKGMVADLDVNAYSSLPMW